TSYLIVPDGAVPVARGGKEMPGPGGGFGGVADPDALKPTSSSAPPVKVEEFARKNQEKQGDLEKKRGEYEEKRLRELAKGDGKGGGDKRDPADKKALDDAVSKKEAYDQAREALRNKDNGSTQAGRLGVELSVQRNNLRAQSELERTALRNVNGRNCMEVGGVWIDEGFDAKTKTLIVKAQSDAYFRILEKQPKVKEVFQLGNHLVWVTPSGTALIIDTHDGKEKL